jgi:hypothetical protein
MLAGEAEHQAMARTVIEPFMRHGVLNHAVADKMLGKLPGDPNMGDYALAIQKQAAGAITGELSTLTQVLMAQALSLDTMFTEVARRATVNMGDYPQASERSSGLQSTVEQPGDNGGAGSTAPAARADREARSRERRRPSGRSR